jgi:hypothetical protein
MEEWNETEWEKVQIPLRKNSKQARGNPGTSRKIWPIAV